jgi:Sulfotransferase family
VSFAADPIFIGGENRSGTTLLSVILDSHPALTMGPELDFLEPADLGPTLVECCELLLAGDPRVVSDGVEAEGPLAAGVQLAKQIDRFGVSFGELAMLARDQLARGNPLRTFDERGALLDAVGEHRRAQVGARRWGLKIQRELLRFDDYHRLWPRAQLVHIIRDGRDVAASHLRAAKRLVYREAERAAHGWVEVIAAGLALADHPRVHSIRYEQLVSEPEAALRPLLVFLGLPWAPALLRHHEAAHALFERPWRHPSADAVRAPIHAAAVGRFRERLHAEELASFEAIAGPTLVRMGYALATVGDPSAVAGQRWSTDASIPAANAESASSSSSTK